MGIPRKVSGGEGGRPGGEFAFQDERWRHRYPFLWEFVARIRWAVSPGDGESTQTEREPGSMIIFVDDLCLLKACLSDKETQQVAFVSGDSLEGLLEALEKGLRDDRLDWRPSASSSSARRNRR
jgi:hypothetical protein